MDIAPTTTPLVDKSPLALLGCLGRRD